MQGQGEVDPMFTNEMIEYESKFYNNALEEDTEKFLLKVNFYLRIYLVSQKKVPTYENS